jgi:ComF family protein
MLMLTRTARRLTNAVFGGSCFLCRGAVRGAREEGLLCAACDTDLPRLRQQSCPRCALGSTDGALCGRCLAARPHFDATSAALQYRFPADVLVHALKFRGELALAALFGRLLAERIAGGERVDLLTAVPLSAARLRERGFNQALEIARETARFAGVRIEPHLALRRRDTAAQSALPWAERAANVHAAFEVRPLAGETVAVVDDVMTTGATLDELARTLKRAGASRVLNWVVARTFPPQDGSAI